MSTRDMFTGSLFDLDGDAVPIVDTPDDDPRAGTVADRAARFHARNPHVYQFAVSIARFMKTRGLQHYGIKAVWEVMRFKYLETTGDIYKLNNSHAAFYARLIMDREPDLSGFFITRACAHDPDYFVRTPRHVSRSRTIADNPSSDVRNDDGRRE